MYSYHIHSTFDDGKNTPEEIVLAAISKGFSAIGFSGHGYTKFDLRYCMQDTDGFIAEIRRLRDKYKKEIQIYLGAEEDLLEPVDRKKFDYIIGSSHYLYRGGKYYSIDSNYDYFKECLRAFDEDVVSLAENYYATFCQYIIDRRPDIIGHFDIVTKFDEVYPSILLNNKKYHNVAEKYIDIATESDSIFEVNTGAIARGLRTTVYPAENLLYILKKKNAKIMLSSDSHAVDTLDFQFAEIKQYLRDLGFQYRFVLEDNQFKEVKL